MRREARKRLEAIELAIDPASAGRRSLDRPAPGRGHRQGAVLRVAGADHGRADGGADGGRGRSPVRHHAQAQRQRRRHRLHLASARGGAADRRPRDGDARRARGRRHRARCAAGRAGAAAGRAPAGRALSRSAQRRPARPLLHLARRAASAWRAKAPAGRRPKTSRSTCTKARSSGWPASWAPGAPNCSARSTAPACRAAGKARSRSTARPVRLEFDQGGAQGRHRLRHRRPARQRPDAAHGGRPQPGHVGASAASRPAASCRRRRQAEAVKQSFGQFDIRPTQSRHRRRRAVRRQPAEGRAGQGDPRQSAAAAARRADARRRCRRQGRDLRAAARSWRRRVSASWSLPARCRS